MFQKKQFILLALVLWLMACGSQAQDHSQHVQTPTISPPKPSENKILHYVDPMHPWYKSDKPGIAPDCGMDLVPVYAEETNPSSSPSSSTSFRLSSEKLQRIGVATEEALVRDLTRHLIISARVTSDPDLYLAQQEYLISRRGLVKASPDLGNLQEDLSKAAQTRLQILGMSASQINALQKSGRAQSSLLLPIKGTSTWILGEVYEPDLPLLKIGQNVEIQVPGLDTPIESRIDSIDPNLNPNTRSAQVRVSVPNGSQNGQPILRPNMFVKMTIHIDLGKVLSIPENAILDTGIRKIVFIEKEPGLFESKEIKTGKRGTGFIEVLSGINQNEKVVTQGNFLLDSESSLKGIAHPSEGHSH